jgi:ABC-type bacteriocin/lantibiotic exporter with double-glycine peptidase domain
MSEIVGSHVDLEALVLLLRFHGATVDAGQIAHRFANVTWFLRAMHKYRHLLGEVLVASVSLRLFALLTQLFFQVTCPDARTYTSISGAAN